MCCNMSERERGKKRRERKEKREKKKGVVRFGKDFKSEKRGVKEREPPWQQE